MIYLGGMSVNLRSFIGKDLRRLAVRRGSVLWLFLMPLGAFVGLDGYFRSAPHQGPGLSTQLLFVTMSVFFLFFLFTQGLLRQWDIHDLYKNVRLNLYCGMFLARVLMGIVQLLFVVLASWGAFRWPIPESWSQLLLLWILFSSAMASVALLWGSLPHSRSLGWWFGGCVALVLSLTNGIVPQISSFGIGGSFLRNISPTAWLVYETGRILLDESQTFMDILLRSGLFFGIAMIGLWWTSRN